MALHALFKPPTRTAPRWSGAEPRYGPARRGGKAEPSANRLAEYDCTFLGAAALAIRPDLALLYTTGFAEGIDRDGAPKHQIAKPYRKDELARKVREALGSV